MTRAFAFKENFMKSKVLGLLALFLFVAWPVDAQTQPASPAGRERSSDEIVRLSWKASKDGDLQTLTSLVDEIIKNYGDMAKL